MGANGDTNADSNQYIYMGSGGSGGSGGPAGTGGNGGPEAEPVDIFSCQNELYGGGGSGGAAGGGSVYITGGTFPLYQGFSVTDQVLSATVTISGSIIADGGGDASQTGGYGAGGGIYIYGSQNLVISGSAYVS
jgi:hypothetical protein